MTALLVTAPGADLATTNKAGKTAEQLARYSLNQGFVPTNTLSTEEKGAEGSQLCYNGLNEEFCFSDLESKISLCRAGNHKSVLALIPGTMEQMQAEMSALRESVRNMQMGQGGARINVPECPVI